jgi:hypothetical protein
LESGRSAAIGPLSFIILPESSSGLLNTDDWNEIVRKADKNEATSTTK